MRGVDTNILARYVIQDDPAQAQLATRILMEPCFVPDTVLLETAWLLSSRYRMRREDIALTIADLVRLPALTVSDPVLVNWAIERFTAGADFADMMHILSSRHTDGFVSFDRRLAKQAGPNTPVPVETPT